MFEVSEFTRKYLQFKFQQHQITSNCRLPSCNPRYAILHEIHERQHIVVIDKLVLFGS